MSVRLGPVRALRDSAVLEIARFGVVPRGVHRGACTRETPGQILGDWAAPSPKVRTERDSQAMVFSPRRHRNELGGERLGRPSTAPDAWRSRWYRTVLSHTPRSRAISRPEWPCAVK